MTTCRFFLLCFLGLSLGSFSGWAAPSKNVLFLVVDDLNTWLLGDPQRYTGRVVAPNIRKFAQSGVLFRQAYTSSPYCSPSRTALFSGVSPWKSGVYDNAAVMEESEPLNRATSLPKLFQEAGYFTASYGKIGHGWHMRKDFDGQLGHKRNPVPPGAPFSPAARGESDWGPTHLAEEEMNDTRYADRAIEQLAREHQQPFFIACGLFHPHMPWYVPQEYFDLFPLEEVVVPELLAGDLEDLPPLADRVLTKRRIVDEIVATGEHQKAVQGYLATTAYADRQIGRVLQALEESPYLDETIVLLMSDHGFHLGEKNHWQKATLWEEATHCLLMMRVPGMTRAGGVSPRFVSLQDLYPTLAELCGLQAPEYVDGRSLVPLLHNPEAAWESTAMSALYERFLAFRTERFRYIRYSEEQEELYDLSKDPKQWTNLADNPEYAEALRKLRARVPAYSEMAKPVAVKKGKR
ncbi:MAG: sulfatase [Verrucomicrobiota bacterium]